MHIVWQVAIDDRDIKVDVIGEHTQIARFVTSKLDNRINRENDAPSLLLLQNTAIVDTNEMDPPTVLKIVLPFIYRHTKSKLHDHDVADVASTFGFWMLRDSLKSTVPVVGKYVPQNEVEDLLK